MSLPKPYFERDGITIYHGDSNEILPEIHGQFHVVADPPYSFGLASSSDGKAGSWGDLMNGAVWYSWMLGQFRRLVGDDGLSWVFNSWRSFPVLARAATLSQWGIESLLVWDKEWIGPGGDSGLRPSYEICALFRGPDGRIADRSTPDIWRAKSSSTKPTGHPAEKPLPLISRMVRASAVELPIIDPFCGSGTTLRAALDNGRKAIGIEIEERWCEVAAKRLAQGVLFT